MAAAALVPSTRAVHFGELLQRLRTERGMTQRDLADRTGISPGTIQRAEYAQTSPLKRSTASAIFSALARVVPIDPDSASAYLKATGLDAGLATMQRFMESPTGKQAAAIHHLLSQLDDVRERRAVEWLFKLIDDAGVERVLDALRGMAAMSSVGLDEKAGERPRAIRLVGPPLQREGYTEQVIRDLEVHERPEPPAARARKRKA